MRLSTCGLRRFFLRRSPLALLGSLLLFIAYMLNQKLLAHSSYMFELEVVIKNPNGDPDDQRGVLFRA